MKIAIIGAGAIGGYVGVKLALAGEDVTFMVRGANLEAIRQRGMVLEMEDGSRLVADKVKASNDYDAVGPQDLVILATKAQQVEAVAASVPKLFGRHRGRDDAERHPVLVLPPARRRARGDARAQRRSDGRDRR
jgi:2-dehydropantoate 2-reductase